MAPAIEVEGLCKDFRLGFLMKNRRILKNLAFRVEQGAIFGFLGPNGAGKTTTIKLLLDLLHPTSGTVRVFGGAAASPATRQRVGYLPDNPYFYDYLTPRELMDYAGRLYGLPAPERAKRTDRLLEMVGIRAHEALPMRKCSRGMLQRIGLAQAMINDPELLILDEPMESLDPMGRKEIREIMLRLKEQGKTLFFSTHILSDVEMISDTAAILVEGKIRKIGPIEQILEAEATGWDLSFEPAESCPILERRDSFERLVDREGVAYLYIGVREELDRVVRELSGGAGRLLSLSPHRPTLEDIFVKSLREAEGES